jgi:Winged helix DNA-binding domain
MARTAPALRIDLERARAHWHRRHGLAEPVKGKIEEVVAATGWPRTLGGVDVYLAVRARVPGMSRRDLDGAVEEARLQVIPAVRGCIYLVPRGLVPLVLRVAEEQQRKRTERDLEKAGSSQREVADVAEAALVALRKGPLSTDALRKAMPEGTVRSLGEKGKKVGLSSPLPPALRHLEFEGKIERTLEEGRLDTERYLWRLMKKSPFTGAEVPADTNARYAAIAKVFFQQNGPATLKDFAGWTALSQRDARAAMDLAPLAPVAVDGYADDAFALEEDLPALREAAPASDSLSLLSFEDNYITQHGGPGPMTKPEHQGLAIASWADSKPSTLGETKHIGMRTVFDGDRLAGLWEYDPDAEAIVFGTFEPLSPKRKRALEARAADLARFLREDIGHAKSFSLDTTDALRARAAIVKAM